MPSISRHMVRSRGALVLAAIALLSGGATAQAPPNFSGKWKRIVTEEKASQAEQNIPATAGSGWGDEITIAHEPATLTIDRMQFVAYDMQPPMRFVYALDGSESRNVINIGRGPQEQVSRTAWQGGTLVITTRHAAGTPLSSDVSYAFSFDGDVLVIEMRRAGGVPPASTTRGRYRKVS